MSEKNSQTSAAVSTNDATQTALIRERMARAESIANAETGGWTQFKQFVQDVDYDRPYSAFFGDGVGELAETAHRALDVVVTYEREGVAEILAEERTAPQTDAQKVFVSTLEWVLALDA